MPKPEDVNPHNFKVEHVLFNHDGFSIAWGTWEGNGQRLGMRWDGDGDAGYPKTFGNPVWFVIPVGLTIPIAAALLAFAGAGVRKTEILSVLTKSK